MFSTAKLEMQKALPYNPIAQVSQPQGVMYVHLLVLILPLTVLIVT